MPGHILLSVLIAIAILGALTRQSLSLCRDLLHSKSALVLASRERQSETENLIPTNEPQEARRLCFKDKTLCLIQHPTLPPSQIITGSTLPFPIVETSVYKQAEINCPMPQPQLDTSTTRSGLALRPDSVVDQATCILSTIPTSAIVAYAENLTLTSPLTIAGNTDTIWSRGYIESRARLTVQAPLTIVASGDLYLAEISTPATQPVAVTIVSLTGTVSLAAISPMIWLKVIARAEAILPSPLPISGDNQRLPLIRRITIE